MYAHVRPLIGILRDPRYTGRNRCWPCTVVNALIVVVVTGVAMQIWLAGALLVAVAGVVAIWLKGYVVPFTPTLAPRVLPTAVVNRLDHGPAGLEAVLDSPMLERQRDRPTYALAGGPAQTRAERLEQYREDGVGEHVRALFGRPASIDRDPDGAVVVSLGDDRFVWPSEVSLLVDRVHDDLCRQHVDGWRDRSRRLRLTRLRFLRETLTTCPVCDHTIEPDRTADSCCGPSPAIVCDSCDTMIRAPAIDS